MDHTDECVYGAENRLPFQDITSVSLVTFVDELHQVVTSSHGSSKSHFGTGRVLQRSWTLYFSHLSSSACCLLQEDIETFPFKQ